MKIYLVLAVAYIIDWAFGLESVGVVRADPVTLGVISLIVAGGTSAYSISESESAKKRARNQRNADVNEQKRLQDDLKNQQQTAETAAAADEAKKSARSRQLALARGGSSRRDTILTQGLGEVGAQAGQSAGGQKTLLGS